MSSFSERRNEQRLMTKALTEGKPGKALMERRMEKVPTVMERRKVPRMGKRNPLAQPFRDCCYATHFRTITIL